MYSVLLRDVDLVMVIDRGVLVCLLVTCKSEMVAR